MQSRHDVADARLEGDFAETDERPGGDRRLGIARVHLGLRRQLGPCDLDEPVLEIEPS
jgi:hypothetical protein